VIQQTLPIEVEQIAVAAAAAVAVQPPIPQELTTMSDQDLISYINPSTFDQREFNRFSLRVSMDGLLRI